MSLVVFMFYCFCSTCFANGMLLFCSSFYNELYISEEITFNNGFFNLERHFHHYGYGSIIFYDKFEPLLTHHLFTTLFAWKTCVQICSIQCLFDIFQIQVVSDTIMDSNELNQCSRKSTKREIDFYN